MPSVDRECRTHHHACDLREAKMAALEAENKQLQETINVMRAEGCAAIGILERIFVGLTARTSPDAAVLKEMVEVAAETLATAAQCDHLAENERLYARLERAHREVLRLPLHPGPMRLHQVAAILEHKEG